MASLGTGIACITSVGPRFSFVSENLCLGQSLVRRLTTPRGALPWAPNDGVDVRSYLNHGSTSQATFSLQRAVRDECEKDERVQSADVAAAFNFGTQTMTLTIGIVTANGPFKLVLLVSQLTVAILDASQ